MSKPWSAKSGTHQHVPHAWYLATELSAIAPQCNVHPDTGQALAAGGGSGYG